MDNNVIPILSLNTRGLREKKKRESLFYWFKQRNASIAFLQETYWTNDLLISIEKEWGGPVFLSPGTFHSKGTAILLNSKVNIEVTNIHKSGDGRIVLINIKKERKSMCLIHTYVPNIPTDRIFFFFIKLRKWIQKYAAKQTRGYSRGGGFKFH